MIYKLDITTKNENWTAYFESMVEIIDTITQVEYLTENELVEYKITPINLDKVGAVVNAVCHICG